MYKKKYDFYKVPSHFTHKINVKKKKKKEQVYIDNIKI